MDEDMDMGGAPALQPAFEPRQVPPQILDDNRKMLYVPARLHVPPVLYLP